MAGKEYDLMPGMKVIYGRDGYPIADVKAAVSRSTLSNDIGEAVFYIASSSNKCRENILRFGNYIVCKSDTLADWVGMIDTPRLWKNGYLEVHAFEVAYILKYRLAPLNFPIEGTPGEKFTQLLDLANVREDTLIRAGNVYTGGVSSAEVITDNVYNEIKRIADNNFMQWNCYPVFDAGGRMTITMDWMDKAANNNGVINVELTQGFNLQSGDTPLEETGELINSIEGVCDVEGEVGTSQITAKYTQEASYGLREARVSFDGITNVDTLLYNCTQLVKQKINPSFGIPLTVVNKGRTFNSLRLHNLAGIRNPFVGFNAGGVGTWKRVRILGIMYNEAANTCELYTGLA